jgi:hypothetical protein
MPYIGDQRWCTPMRARSIAHTTDIRGNELLGFYQSIARSQDRNQVRIGSHIGRNKSRREILSAVIDTNIMNITTEELTEDLIDENIRKRLRNRLAQRRRRMRIKEQGLLQSQTREALLPAPRGPHKPFEQIEMACSNGLQKTGVEIEEQMSTDTLTSAPRTARLICADHSLQPGIPLLSLPGESSPISTQGSVLADLIEWQLSRCRPKDASCQKPFLALTSTLLDLTRSPQKTSTDTRLHDDSLPDLQVPSSRPPFHYESSRTQLLPPEASFNPTSASIDEVDTSDHLYEHFQGHAGWVGSIHTDMNGTYAVTDDHLTADGADLMFDTQFWDETLLETIELR